MTRGLLSDRGELEALFHELARELAESGTSAEVVMVGGSWMLWHSQRASTRDVDSARRFGTDLTEAVDRVGSRHDLRKGWLNDAAAAFWPSGVSYESCVTVFEPRGAGRSYAQRRRDLRDETAQGRTSGPRRPHHPLAALHVRRTERGGRRIQGRLPARSRGPVSHGVHRRRRPRCRLVTMTDCAGSNCGPTDCNQRVSQRVSCWNGLNRLQPDERHITTSRTPVHGLQRIARADTVC
jgi:hypothetical protein